MQRKSNSKQYPLWLKKRFPKIGKSIMVSNILKKYDVHTVCRNARCPNIFECYGKGTATFLILGNICSRNCKFCAITKNISPLPPDPNEINHITKVVNELKLSYIVITSVSRDDLPDKGANHFVNVLNALRKMNESLKIEVLVPDFDGEFDLIKKIVDARPNVFNHNIETVPSLYPKIRPMADFHRSLKVLEIAKNLDSNLITKSGIILGVGETTQEVIYTFKKLKEIQCDVLTIGQYLQPSKNAIAVKDFIPPHIFEFYKHTALKLGFKYVVSGPFVRSSFNAKEAFEYAKEKYYR